MGSILEATGSARPRPGRPEGSVALAARAAKSALREAGRSAGELGALVYTGVYRDGFTSEPAMAPFVQRRLGANPRMGAGGPRTFSFDLTNGGCGLLQAAEILDGLLRSGRTECAMVVASDVDPSPRRSQGLDLAPAGAALCLGPGPEGAGFVAFRTVPFPEHADLAASRVRWREGGPWPGFRRTRYAVHREEAPGFAEACAACAAKAIESLLAAQGVTRVDLDLVLPSQTPRGFPRALGECLGMGAERIVDATGRGAPAHTAGPVLALRSPAARARWPHARHVLFVAVAAGVVVSLALYVRPEASAPPGSG